MKIVMKLSLVLAVCSLGYDVWYLFSEESGAHIPFLFTGVLAIFAGLIKLAGDLPPEPPGQEKEPAKIRRDH